MGLVVRDVVRRGASMAEGVSPFFISVDKRYLSEPYMLTVLTRINASATILDVGRVGAPLSSEERRVFEEHVIGKKVLLHVSPGGFAASRDALYFCEESWALLRDAGVLPEEYEVKVRVTELTIRELSTGEERRVEVYPYRDVEGR